MKIYERDGELLNALINFYEDIDYKIKNDVKNYDNTSLTELVKRRNSVKGYIINYATSFLNNVLDLDNATIDDIKNLIIAGKTR